jgi:hypothetical protein
MKKIFLFTITLLAIGAMYFSPVTVEAFDPPDSPTVDKACASCHGDHDTEIGTDLGKSVKSEAEQVAMEATAESPYLADSETAYAEAKPSYDYSRVACGGHVLFKTNDPPIGST